MLHLGCSAFLLSAGANAASSNPFAATPPSNWYVNPANQAEYDASIQTATGAVKQALQQMRAVPSAYWIDRKSKIRGNTTDTLEGILHDAAGRASPPLVVFLLYDLPNRDCSAKASNGEICCTYKADRTCDYTAASSCEDGLQEYKATYVDPFATVVGQYSKRVPVVVVIEPDSLPNLATNQGNPHCGNSATSAAYKQGVAYAVQKLHALAPDASLYVDAAHGGWLGWADNAQKFAKLVGELKIAPLIRGFSSNVANYQALGEPCPAEAFDKGLPQYCSEHATARCCVDPCGLLHQYNSGNSESNYVQQMSRAVSQVVGGGFVPRWIIDTGRNGVTSERSDCSNWCNVRGAGAGLRPTPNTSLPAVVDAYFWLKTPGESDGCTQLLPGNPPASCPRFDSMCASVDSIGSKSGEPRAPQAGAWFDYQVKQLAANAQLGPMPSPSPSPGPSPSPKPPAPPPPPPSPSACPGGNLTACMALCPSSKYAQCVQACADNCPPGGTASQQGSVAKPFSDCTAEGTSCVLGYVCHHQAHVCWPTKAKQLEAAHHGAFHTALEHARERLRLV